MTNFFDPRSAAGRYAAGRPYHQDIPIDNVRTFLQIDGKLGAAIDVACGTGLSGIALKAIAERIVGCDISPEMIAQAADDDVIAYVVCTAEALGTADKSFDLMTVSSAFHWFDREAFLSEARRVLKPEASLVIYNNAFTGKMAGDPSFQEWSQETYVQRFPTPPRNTQPFEDSDAERAGFHFRHRENYINDVVFEKNQLVNYLTTQTNVIAVVEGGTSTIEEVQEFLDAELGRFFPSSETKHSFGFWGPIWYLARR